MDKTFTVAGTSNLNGETKVRFANDLVVRIKVLGRNGHTAINLVELPQAMTKEDAVRFLSTLDSFGTMDEKAAIAGFLSKIEPAAPKAKAPEAKSKAPKAKKAEKVAEAA
jgi:hypothetical protein